jgi:two-component system chemotaxis response regulator CheY
MMVIDDSKVMRTLLASLARKMAFATTEACDGREALDLLVKSDPREPFDVALVDWEMPRMNGLEFVEAVRRNGDFNRLKIVMVTIQNERDKVAEALRTGADDYLMKPITRELLKEKLRVIGLLD